MIAGSGILLLIRIFVLFIHNHQSQISERQENSMANHYERATAPTIYFIGVTTGSSSIMKVFPKWAKALGLKDKLPTMTEDEQLALLASDGMLVKRPLLVGDDFVLPGFKQAEWENALL